MSRILSGALIGVGLTLTLLLPLLFIVSHRLRQSRDTNRLLVQEGGRVLERNESLQRRLATASDTLADAIFLKIVDWGPDFTGEGDVLHRYRWTLWHREVAIDSKELLMLGNSPSYAEAVMDAFSWIEQQANPGVEVALWGAEDLTESL